MFPSRCEMLDEFRLCFESSNILLMYQIKCFALEDVIFKITCPSIFDSDNLNAELRSKEPVNSQTYSNISNRQKYLISFDIHFVNNYLCSLNGMSYRQNFQNKLSRSRKINIKVQVMDKTHHTPSPEGRGKKNDGTYDQTVTNISIQSGYETDHILKSVSRFVLFSCIFCATKNIRKYMLRNRLLTKC